MPVYYRWHLLTIDHEMTPYGFIVTTTSNKACHMYLRYSDVFPRIHRKSVLRRGVAFGWDARFCFTVYHHIEQNEPGDTLTHTFTWPGWANCETRYFYFWAFVDGHDAVSDSPIFWLHYLWVAPPLIIREGITKFALREGTYDCTGVEPPYNQYESSSFRVRMRDDAEAFWPYLQITYRLPGGPPITVKFYPTPGSDGVAADGRAGRTQDNSTWASMRAGAGTFADPGRFTGMINFICGGLDGTWYSLTRTLLHFDTLLLPLASIIEEASVHVYGYEKGDAIPSSPSLALVESTDPTPGDITLPDYQNLKSTPIAPVIPYADFSYTGWNVFILPESAWLI